MTQTFATPAYWNERYQCGDYVYGCAPNDFLRAHATLFVKGAKVLSLAEGEGRNAVFLATQGCKVQGVDFSAQGQEKAQQLAKNHGVKIGYDLADLTVYDMGDAAWDGIISVFCHLPERKRANLYESVIRALKPGGIFLLESYNKRQPDFCTGGPNDASYLLSCDELKAPFSGFEVLMLQDVERNVQEGHFHNGQSSVTQFIARKPA